MGATLEAERASEWARMHATKAPALAAFNEAKFGMFIHWGLYSLPGGVWKGERMEDGGVGPGVAEWVMRRKSIPRDEYAQLAEAFNPVGFDADEWAQLAADAGMRYMVITTKHHDGFALFESNVSAYNIVDATPFKRDVVAELHGACERTGVRFGAYYSHTLDWYDGGDYGLQYAEKNGDGTPTCIVKAVNDWDPSPRKFDDYMQNKSVAQVTELAQRYPDLFLVWFDGAGHIPAEISHALYEAIYEHAPQALVNSRISKDDLPDKVCDYQSAGDNHVPTPDEIESTHWETCGTTNNSWGFKSYDQDWKCALEVLSWLVDVVSRGGNYLLNVGPDGNGKIPAACVAILRDVGAWMRVNGEAIYGSRAWTVSREGPTQVARTGTGNRAQAGFSTAFTAQDFWFTSKGKTVYAIGLAQPADRQVLVRSLADVTVAAVRMLGSEDAVDWEQTPDGLRVRLPSFLSKLGYALAIKVTA